MILPVFAFGQPVLTKKAEPISKDYPLLREMIDDMWETMYEASGIGLAAPQIGKGIRLFVVDTLKMRNKVKDDSREGIRKVFINPEIKEEFGNLWMYEEGCLSIPDVRGEVERFSKVKIRYFDEDFVPREEIYEGIEARVIQHEYDHLEGKLFIEYLSPTKKIILRGKLENIKKGKVPCDYPMRFVKK
jgi:peptide deformylase